MVMATSQGVPKMGEDGSQHPAQSKGLITVIYVKGGSQGGVRPDAAYAQEYNRPVVRAVVSDNVKDKRNKL